MKTLTNYRFIQTDDGSTTVFSEAYGETCHSTSGAIEETKLHYIDGCEIVKRSHDIGNIQIFEVGFGVGIGFFETLKALDKKFIFVTTEIDEELVEWVLDNNTILTSAKKINSPTPYYYLNTERFELYILLGNARESILHLSHLSSFSFNAIYQDAFSPKRNAILWTTEWFKALKNCSHSNCIMSTYSASSSIRKSMIAAGWKLYNGANFGVKRSSTRAKLTGETEPEIIKHLKRSPVIEITDNNYKEYTLGN